MAILRGWDVNVKQEFLNCGGCTSQEIWKVPHKSQSSVLSSGWKWWFNVTFTRFETNNLPLAKWEISGMNPWPSVTSQMLDIQSYPCTHFGRTRRENSCNLLKRLVDSNVTRRRTCKWAEERRGLLITPPNVAATSTLSHTTCMDGWRQAEEKDTGYWTFFSGPPSLCSTGTSASFPQCTILLCRTHGTWIWSQGLVQQWMSNSAKKKPPL